MLAGDPSPRPSPAKGEGDRPPRASAPLAKPLTASIPGTKWNFQRRPIPPAPSATVREPYDPLPPHLPVATLKLPQESGGRQSEIRFLESGR
jgi:hypothetical protein